MVSSYITNKMVDLLVHRIYPHDAFVRMDLGNLGELSAWVNR